MIGLQKFDDRQCPLCGGDNQCKVGVHKQVTCWCMETKFPKELLNAVPKESKGKQCICQDCLDTYKSL